MANLPQTLIPILLLLAAVATPALSQLPSSTSFFYDFNRQQRTGLTFQGDAHFSSNPTTLRLNSARNTAVGRVLYTHPVHFWQSCGQVDFETTLTFLITPNPGHSPADGIVFFIAPVRTQLGSGGGHLGVFDASGRGAAVLAVEFDTYINPEVDPNFRHVGINLGSWRSSNVTNVGDAIIGQPVTARISYAGATGMIRVEGNAGWQRFEVSFRHDLSGFLPQQVQVGLSASTGISGNFVATHDVMSWHFTSTMVNTGRGSPRIRQVV